VRYSVELPGAPFRLLVRPVARLVVVIVIPTSEEHQSSTDGDHHDERGGLEGEADAVERPHGPPLPGKMTPLHPDHSNHQGA